MSHWTEELFKEHPELFLGFFEQRMEEVPAEVDFLLEKVKALGFKPERLLDLNCGIGRHSIELGRRGMNVLGTDISSRYIQIAQERAKEAGVSVNAKFQVADMRNIHPILAGGSLFDGIICLWTSFGFYDDATNEDILSQCLKLVKPGGFFALDIVNRDWLMQNFVDRGFQQNERGLVLEERQFDPYTSRNHNTWKFFKQVSEDTFKSGPVIKLDHRIWSLHELIILFEKTGWKHAAVYPGFSKNFLSSKTVAQSTDNILQNAMLLTIYRRPL